MTLAQQDNQRHFAKRLRDGVILPRDTPLVLSHYKEPLRQVEDGYGYMGTLAKNEDDSHIQCHICGYLFRNLGTHVAQAHKISAKDYRVRFSLSSSTGLVSGKERTRLIDQQMKVSSVEKLRRLTALQNAHRVTSSSLPVSRRSMSLETRNLEGSCPDQLLDKIEKLAGELHRTPSKTDFIERYGHGFFSSILNIYGSWNFALSLTGMMPTNHTVKTRRYTRESVIIIMREFYRMEGRVPRHSDFGEHNLLPSRGTIQRLFGGIIAARREAGFGQNDYLNEEGL